MQLFVFIVYGFAVLAALIWLTALIVHHRTPERLEAFPDVAATALKEHAAIMRQDLRYAARTFGRSPGYAASRGTTSGPWSFTSRPTR